MNQNRTASILQRFAVVLAVTTASYGLPQAQARTTAASHQGQPASSHTAHHTQAVTTPRQR
jgi:hypothetical protein